MSRYNFDFWDWAFTFGCIAAVFIAVACLGMRDPPMEGDKCCFERLDRLCWKYGRLQRTEDGTGLYCVLTTREP